MHGNILRVSLSSLIIIYTQLNYYDNTTLTSCRSLHKCNNTELLSRRIKKVEAYAVQCGLSGKTRICGAEGTRTPHLLNAIQTLYQMSYSPGVPAVLRAGN